MDFFWKIVDFLTFQFCENNQSYFRPETEFRESFVSPRLEPSSRDHLLQNSCDRILQSHHSVSGSHSVNSYSQSRTTKQSQYNYRGY